MHFTANNTSNQNSQNTKNLIYTEKAFDYITEGL